MQVLIRTPHNTIVGRRVDVSYPLSPLPHSGVAGAANAFTMSEDRCTTYSSSLVDVYSVRRKNEIGNRLPRRLQAFSVCVQFYNNFMLPTFQKRYAVPPNRHSALPLRPLSTTTKNHLVHLSIKIVLNRFSSPPYSTLTVYSTIYRLPLQLITWRHASVNYIVRNRVLRTFTFKIPMSTTSLNPPISNVQRSH